MRGSAFQASPALDKILTEQKVVVCAGCGGVGKTTVAAALGVRAAQLGLRVLVLTVDPAKRLATALGLDLSDDSERRVPGQSFKGELHAAVIDSRKTFDQFIARHASNPEAASRILRNRLYQQLSTTLSGSQEFTSLERLLLAVESGRFDLVILDTPPTKHALDFFMAPQRIHSLFQDNVTKWFIEATQPSSGGGLISALVQRGTRTVLKSLEALTGGQFIEELVDFFGAIRNIQQTLRDRSAEVQRLLGGTRTKFIVITSFDTAKLEEAKYLQAALRRMGFALEAVVINRAYPIWLPKEDEGAADAAALGPVYEKVLKFYDRFKQFNSLRYNHYEEFARSLRGSARIFRIPEYDQDIHGLSELQSLASRLAEGAESP